MTTTHPETAPMSRAATPVASPSLHLIGRSVQRARRTATTDSLAPWIRQVTPDVSFGTRPHRRYWGDCYRRAADYVLSHSCETGLPAGALAGPPVAGPRLVHGVCRDARDLWAHAWVDLPGALVFDGVRQQFYDREGYCRVLGAVPEASYDLPMMVERMHASGRYGPWHAGVLGRNATGRLSGFPQ